VVNIVIGICMAIECTCLRWRHDETRFLHSP
jgi:hypothetical protein